MSNSSIGDHFAGFYLKKKSGCWIYNAKGETAKPL